VRISHFSASSCKARSMSSSLLAFAFDFRSFFASGLGDEDAGVDDAEGS
jgi:hypothetical protein